MAAEIHSYPISGFPSDFMTENYSVILLNGSGVFSVDQINYFYEGYTVLFLSPYQKLKLLPWSGQEIFSLFFHGDYYCIEYHKEEVACNGLLFNNIYLHPAIRITRENYEQIHGIFNHIRHESSEEHPFSTSIIKTYIQLVLAICSKQKSNTLQDEMLSNGKTANKNADAFRKLLELHFKEEKEPSFYSNKLHIAGSTLSKSVKKEFGKTPGQLIKEKIILEAKRLLHLTYRSVKEIAVDLGFHDEFYFSRYFKKSVGCSPKKYREKVGISIVAKMSM
ncbi:MAG: helix-turn-helix domain-containing protein [Chryseobacterium sp.]|jgi:AraC-like DNA-binding protein|uniref:helix-turn-helix domain-containing protein n=1 Tax=Chryseobacterium sp. TaxID=1871047 RepID=UPI00282763AC|nr:helix-turn-helix domain-containing protein [Chryseobacterium sp.]MDR2234720.1 helix-turn-helix domain-containing protein [Chryseobacterium sp.]